MAKYRKKPVVVEAIQWTGRNYTKTLDPFLGNNWGRADVKEVAWEHEDAEEVVVWNGLEKIWIPCPVGHWIIRGIKGEFYPCDPEAFEQSYEPMGDE